MSNLRQTLAHEPLLADGGMGTQLILRGLPPGVGGEVWNLERPGSVAEVHALYVDAGCRLITTNTFGATRPMLDKHDLAARVADMNAKGVAIARQAADGRAWVMGDVGPFGGFLEPMGDTTPEQLTAIFHEQVAALRAAGADGVIIETMADPGEIAVAINVARGLSADWVIAATYAFQKGPDGILRTMMGTTVAEAVQAAITAGADVVGANCGTGLALPDYLVLARELVAAAGSTPVILQPNAGAPEIVAGKTVYRATPDDMARLVPDLRAAGVRIIGGCCGTTPAHLAAMAKTFR